MNIAEFFVNLGVKGSEKTVSALSNVKKSLGDMTATSLEAKAAIIGAVYALEKLMSNSAATGTGLSNFNALTGISTKQLQQWQFAARQAGESSEEFTGSLKGVQDKMAQMKLNKGAPEGLALLANTVGFDAKKAYKDTFYVMEQLQKFAQSNVSKDVQNQVMKSFGVSENTIAAMRKGVFNQQNFQKAPTYGEGEINKLNKVDVAWKNLGQTVEMAFGHFTSKHGEKLVSDLSAVTAELFKMINAFTKLADKLEVFKVIGKVFEGWGYIFNGIANVAGGITGDKEGVGHGLKEEAKGIGGGLVDLYKGMQTHMEEQRQASIAKNLEEFKGSGSWLARSIAPSAPAGGAEKTVNQSPTINQHLHFQHDGKDHSKIKDAAQKGINHAWKQSSAQSQGS